MDGKAERVVADRDKSKRPRERPPVYPMPDTPDNIGKGNPLDRTDG